MKQNGQFILMNKNEFYTYMMNLQVSRKITSIQNHHTAEPSYNDCNGNNHIELMQNMKNYHVNECGFSDIAQQFSVFPDGLICTGRSMNVDPAGIAKHNSNNICIENIGNFDIGGDNMTQAQKDSIIFLNAILCLKFNLPINNETVIYHTWFGYLDNRNIKECPGNNFFHGNTKNDAQNYFYPLIITELNRLKNPKPQIPDWMWEGCKWLVDNGFCNSLHSPNEQISFSLFASIVNNKLHKLPSLDPINYLMQNKWIRQAHDQRELLSIGLLGYLLANHFGDTVTTSPVEYMVTKGFLNNNRPQTDILTFSLLGAILKNGATKGFNI